MEDTCDSPSVLTDHVGGVNISITGMDDHRPPQLLRQVELSPKDGTLYLARRVVVVEIQPAFPNGSDARLVVGGFTHSLERLERTVPRLVRMDPCGSPELSVVTREL